MTAEVAIMNRNALVLAADSATTVTAFFKGEKETRYFKGANKLFQLSNSHPVGLMIYGSASLQSAPWELIVKEFRVRHGEESSDKLSDYSRRFFDFVKGNTGLFPEDQKKEDFLDKAEQAAFVIFVKAMRESEADDGEKRDKAAVRALVDKRLTETLEALKNETPPAPITLADTDAAVATHIDEFIKVLAKSVKEAFGDSFDDSQAPVLAEAGLRELLMHYSTYLSETGVVIGGYGGEEFFPSFEVFECYGFLDRHFIANRENDMSLAIGKNKPAAIQPFATASMINTFRLGVGPDIFVGIVQATEAALQEISSGLKGALDREAQIRAIEGKLEQLVTDCPDTTIRLALAELLEAVRTTVRQTAYDIDKAVKEIGEKCRDNWMQNSRNEHYWPFVRVVAALPIPDMAAVAKSLVELQSLKERVTDSSESVGGPIDVASITKHDGFVWIERKHYFKPELNPRFFLRQRAKFRGLE